MVYWRCCKKSCREESQCFGDQLATATNNHPVRNLTELRVEQIKSNLRNRPRKEVAPVPAICIVELTTQPDCSEVASGLLTFSSLKSSLYRRYFVAGNRTFLVFLLYCLTIRKTFNYCNTQFMLSGIRHFVIRHSGIRHFVIRHSGIRHFVIRHSENDSTSQIFI